MKKQILNSIVCLSLVFISFSCTNDTESNEVQEMNSKVQADVDFIIRSAETIRKEVEGNRNLLPNFSTQSELDNYLVLVGEPPGSVSLSFFNQVIGGIGMAETEGLQYVLDQSTYSTFAKSTFLTNSNGEIIPDLTQQADFLNLNLSEKETVLLTNTLINDLPPELHSPECGVAIIAGISIGGAICGAPCSIGGAVVGIVVCFWIKDHQQ